MTNLDGIEPSGGYVAFTPGEVVPLGPLPVGEGTRGTGELDVCLHEAEADVQLRVLLFDGDHLAAVIGIEQPLGLHDHPVGQDEVWCVDRFDLVREGPPLVGEWQAPLL